MLGWCYEKGLGVEQDRAEANQYYQIAADGGNPASQSNIGNSYYKGDGIEQNYDRAVKYFTLAMERRVPNALFALGDCCYEGKGLEKDLDKARNGTGKPLRPDMSWMRKTGHT